MIHRLRTCNPPPSYMDTFTFILLLLTMGLLIVFFVLCLFFIHLLLSFILIMFILFSFTHTVFYARSSISTLPALHLLQYPLLFEEGKVKIGFLFNSILLYEMCDVYLYRPFSIYLIYLYIISVYTPNIISSF